MPKVIKVLFFRSKKASICEENSIKDGRKQTLRSSTSSEVCDNEIMDSKKHRRNIIEVQERKKSETNLSQKTFCIDDSFSTGKKNLLLLL
jgi:hypothetical protein